MIAVSPIASPAFEARAPKAIALKAGIGLRAKHHAEIVASRPGVGWFEIHAENYMGGGPPLHYLDSVRALYPVAVHGVGLSLASANGIDSHHLQRLARLVERVEPMIVSEHLAWTSLPDQRLYLNDLMPLPYTEQALDAVAANIDRVQTTLRRPILIENPSLYLTYADSPISEPDFLAALAYRTGCGILCDVNNIYVSACNHGWNASQYLAALPGEAIGEIHLAGHARCVFGTPRSPGQAKRDPGDAAAELTILIDNHGSRVAEPVWALFDEALARFGPKPTLIEWDTDIPDFSVLQDEAARAERALRNAGERHACAA